MLIRWFFFSITHQFFRVTEGTELEVEGKVESWKSKKESQTHVKQTLSAWWCVLGSILASLPEANEITAFTVCWAASDFSSCSLLSSAVAYALPSSPSGIWHVLGWSHHGLPLPKRFRVLLWPLEWNRNFFLRSAGPMVVVIWFHPSLGTGRADKLMGPSELWPWWVLVLPTHAHVVPVVLCTTQVTP